MLRVLIVSCLALLLSSPGVSAAAPKKVHVAAGVDAPEEEADRYLKANLELVQKRLPELIRACARSADPGLVKDFEFAVEVGKGGIPAKTLATPSNAFTTCVTRTMNAMRFTDPPRAPLGVYFEVAIRE